MYALLLIDKLISKINYYIEKILKLLAVCILWLFLIAILLFVVWLFALPFYDAYVNGSTKIGILFTITIIPIDILIFKYEPRFRKMIIKLHQVHSYNNEN